MKHSTFLIGSLSFLMLAACMPAANNSDMAAGKRKPIQWVATHTGADDQGIPESTLELKVVGSPNEVLYTTDECLGVPSMEQLQDVEGSIASIQCWWAGGGDQWAVFVGDAEQLTVKTRTVDEEAGYGEWQDLKTL